MWRQGDIFIAQVKTIPSTAKLLPHCILAEGEMTGHSHRIADIKTAQLFADGSERFLRVLADSAELIHQEHGPITLLRGDYRVWPQREYTPEAIRIVRD